MIIEVEADFSQFYLMGAKLEYDPTLVGKVVSPGLIDGDGENIWFTSFRQHGSLPIDAEILDTEPGSLGAEWGDVVDFSITTLPGFGLAGWDEPTTPISADIGVELRARYAVANADEAHLIGEPPYPECYQLRFWPARLAPATVMRSETAAGEYWNFQFGAQKAKPLALEHPEGERTRAIVDIAFRDHPESAEKIARGDVQFTSGIVAYAQQIYPPEYEHDELKSIVIAAAMEFVAGAK